MAERRGRLEIVYRTCSSGASGIRGRKDKGALCREETGNEEIRITLRLGKGALRDGRGQVVGGYKTIVGEWLR